LLLEALCWKLDTFSSSIIVDLFIPLVDTVNVVTIVRLSNSKYQMPSFGAYILATARLIGLEFVMQAVLPRSIYVTDFH